MKISVGSDEKTILTDFVVEELKRRGHTTGIDAELIERAKMLDVRNLHSARK